MQGTSTNIENKVVPDYTEKGSRRRVRKLKRHNDDYEKSKMLKVKPNYFLAFQVNSSSIHKQVKILQEKIIESEKKLFPALISVPTLHVTLAVTCLNKEDDILAVTRTLYKWGCKNASSFIDNPLTVNLDGLDTFGTRVLFIKLKDDNNLKRLSDLAKQMGDVLESSGFPSTENRLFHPHLTVLKLTKCKNLLKESKNFKPLFQNLKTTEEFNQSVTVNSVQLLPMNKPKDEKGYYHCIYEVKFRETGSEDHTFCCSPIKRPLYITKIKKDLNQRKGSTKKYFHAITTTKFHDVSEASHILSKENIAGDAGNFVKLGIIFGAIALFTTITLQDFILINTNT